MFAQRQVNAVRDDGDLAPGTGAHRKSMGRARQEDLYRPYAARRYGVVGFSVRVGPVLPGSNGVG